MRRLDQPERDALHAAARGERFRFDLVRGGVTLRSFDAQGSVSLSSTDSIGRTARLTVYDREIDWLKDRVKPYLLLDVRVKRVTCAKLDALGLTCAQLDGTGMTCAQREAGELFSPTLFLRRSWRDLRAAGKTWRELRAGGATWRTLQAATPLVQKNIPMLMEMERREFPLGLFIPSSPVLKTDENGESCFDVSAYDCTVILREDCLTEWLYFAAGTAYLDAVQSILMGAGITEVIVSDRSSAALPTDREFETGMGKLEIVNLLLSEINYNKLRCDADGTFILSKYREPTIENVDYIYAADSLSVIEREVTAEQDFYRVPNVFAVTVSNPELATEFHARYVNDNPASRLSTVQRGRSIVKIVEPPDVVASQEDLDLYLRRMAFEASQVYENAAFYTALMPMHESGDILALHHPELSGVYVESGWEMELSAGGRMTHQARKLVVL